MQYANLSELAHTADDRTWEQSSRAFAETTAPRALSQRNGSATGNSYQRSLVSASGISTSSWCKARCGRLRSSPSSSPPHHWGQKPCQRFAGALAGVSASASSWIATPPYGSLIRDPSASLPARRECWIPVPLPAPVGFSPNSLRHFRDREKAQLSQAFAQQARGLESGTFREFALRMAICLRSLRVGHFTLQAFSQAVSGA
jgi:hypothetical protein